MEIISKNWASEALLKTLEDIKREAMKGSIVGVCQLIPIIEKQIAQQVEASQVLTWHDYQNLSPEQRERLKKLGFKSRTGKTVYYIPKR